MGSGLGRTMATHGAAVYEEEIRAGLLSAMTADLGTAGQ